MVGWIHGLKGMNGKLRISSYWWYYNSRKIFIALNIYREYDFQSVLTASSVVYGFALGAPAIIWFIFKQYEPNLLLMSTICLYGYGIAVFLPSVVSYICIYIQCKISYLLISFCFKC